MTDKSKRRRPKIKSPILSLSFGEMREHLPVYLIVTMVIGLSVTSFTVSNAYSGYMMQTIQNGLQGVLTGDALILGPGESPRSALGGANPFFGYLQIAEALETEGLVAAPRIILQGAAFYKIPGTITGMEINKLLESKYEGLVLIGVDLDKDPQVFAIENAIVPGEGRWFDPSEIENITRTFWGDAENEYEGIHHKWEYEGLEEVGSEFSLSAIKMRFMTVCGAFNWKHVEYRYLFTPDFVIGFYGDLQNLSDGLNFSKIVDSLSSEDLSSLFSEDLLRSSVESGNISAEALKALLNFQFLIENLDKELIKELMPDREFSFRGNTLLANIGPEKLISIVNETILLEKFVEEVYLKLTVKDLKNLLPDEEMRVNLDLEGGKDIDPSDFKGMVDPDILRKFSSRALKEMIPGQKLFDAEFLSDSSVDFNYIYSLIPATAIKEKLRQKLGELSAEIVPGGILGTADKIRHLDSEVLREAFLAEKFRERFDDKTIIDFIKGEDFRKRLYDEFNPGVFNLPPEAYQEKIALLKRVRENLDQRLAQLEVGGNGEGENLDEIMRWAVQLRGGIGEDFLRTASPHLPLEAALRVYGGIEDFAIPVIVGKALADNLNLTVGEVFNSQLMTGSTLGSMGGSSNCRIVGIYEIGIPILEQMVQVAPLNIVRMVLTADGKYLTEDEGWGENTVVSIGVSTPYGPDENPEKIRSAVYEALPEGYRGNVTILGWNDIVEYVVGPIMTVINIMLLLSIFVTLLLCAMTIKYVMDSTVLRKTREIGTLKAVGATSSNVAGIFLIQALIIGILASLIGFGGSVGILYGLNHMLGGGTIVGATIDVWFVLTWRWWVLALVFVMPTAIALVSALIPAYRAAKLSPVESIRKGEMAL